MEEPLNRDSRLFALGFFPSGFSRDLFSDLSSLSLWTDLLDVEAKSELDFSLSYTFAFSWLVLEK